METAKRVRELAKARDLTVDELINMLIKPTSGAAWVRCSLCGATFTLSYLKDMVDAAVVSSEVAALELSTDMPMKMDFELPQGKLVYYLAPCIGT